MQLFERLMDLLLLTAADKRLLRVVVGAVSYTHLDVYKRQALHQVQAEPFVISTAGVGRFRRSTGDILWAGIAKNAQLEACLLYTSRCV